jgi:hypothetical protein
MTTQAETAYKQALDNASRVMQQTNDTAQHAKAKKALDDASAALAAERSKSSKPGASGSGGGVWDYLMGSTK